jgi:uncharacterized protein YndB with AHSA1/START domain
MTNSTTVERLSERELVVRRTFDAPARIVFQAWTRSEWFKQWWVPKSCGMTLLSCEQDVRVGGRYRLEFKHPAAPDPIAFFGQYLEVTPPSRLVWTKEESPDTAITVAPRSQAGFTPRSARQPTLPCALLDTKRP